MRNKFGRLRRIRLRHPGRQQRQRVVRLANDEMVSACVALASNNRNQFAATGMKPIADQNFKCRTPGIMPLV